MFVSAVSHTFYTLFFPFYQIEIVLFVVFTIVLSKYIIDSLSFYIEGTHEWQNKKKCKIKIDFGRISSVLEDFEIFKWKWHLVMIGSKFLFLFSSFIRCNSLNKINCFPRFYAEIVINCLKFIFLKKLFSMVFLRQNKNPIISLVVKSA